MYAGIYSDSALKINCQVSYATQRYLAYRKENPTRQFSLQSLYEQEQTIE